MIKAAMFDTKDYDKIGFEKYRDGIEIKYFETRLSEDTVGLCNGCEVAVIFVNDKVNREVIINLKEL